MQKRNVLHSPRLLELKNKRRRVFLTRIFLIIGGILILTTGLSFLSRISSVNIHDVEVTGNTVVDAQAVKDIANQELAGDYLWVFPKTNIFFYPKNKIKLALIDKFTRLGSINLSIKSNSTLHIDLTERIGVYTWCGATPPALGATSEICDFLDKDGYIFDTAPYFSANVYLKFYGKDELNVDAPIGSYFAPDIFTKLISFYQATESMNLSPQAFYIEDDGDIHMLLSPGNNAKSVPEILFNTTADMETTLENLETALDADPLKTEFKNEYSSLQYIDLRFGNKVYYKFTTGNAPTTIP